MSGRQQVWVMIAAFPFFFLSNEVFMEQPLCICHYLVTEDTKHRHDPCTQEI